MRINHAFPDVVGQGLLNVAKWRHLSKILRQMKTLQAAQYNLAAVPEIRTVLQNLPQYYPKVRLPFFYRQGFYY